MKTKIAITIIGLFALVAIIAGCGAADISALMIGGGAVLSMGFPAVGKFRPVTPQNKLATVANRLGNPGLKNNQGTTFEIWDYVQVQTSTQSQMIEFFVNPQSKNYPFTNMPSNTLSPGEGLVLERMAFTYMVVTTATGEVDTWKAAAQEVVGFKIAEFEILQDNQRILKSNSMCFANDIFNEGGGTSQNFTFRFDTLLTIQPEIPFTVRIKIPPVTVAPGEGNKGYLGVHLQGAGSILNTKSNF